MFVLLIIFFLKHIIFLTKQKYNDIIVQIYNNMLRVEYENG